MVLYFKLPLDHLGYPAKGPQIRGESGRSGPLPENLRQTLFLVSRKARGTAGMGFGAQSFYPLLLEHFFQRGGSGDNIPALSQGRGMFSSPLVAPKGVFLERLFPRPGGASDTQTVPVRLQGAA
jgi:hypothetical protein